MILPGIRAVVVYNPATGGTVQIPNIVARSFEFSKVPYDTGERSPMGASVEQADSSSVGFEFVDTDGSLWQALDALRLARTRVSLIAVGSSVCVQWYETDHFTITRLPLGGAMVGRGDVYSFEMTREGHGRHAIYQQANLIAHVAGVGGGAWKEGSGNLAEGYTHTGTGTLAWVSLTNGQGVTHNAADAGIYVDIIFPLKISGYTITLNSTINDTHSDTATAKIRLLGEDFSSVSVANAVTEAGSGVRSASISTASGTDLYKIRVYPILTPSGVSGSDQVNASYPVVRVDSSTDFVQH